MKPVSWIADPSLTVNVASVPLALPDALQARVEAHWSQAQKQHTHFFRGPVLSLQSIQRYQAGWSLATQFTDFAHYLYSREHLEASHPHRVRVVFAAALVVSRDRQLLAGVMGKDTARPYWLQSIGGAATWDDVQDGQLDPGRSTAKEFREETGLAVEQLSLARPPEILGCTVDHNGSVAIAVGYLSQLSTAELLNAIHRNWSRRPETELYQVIALDLGTKGAKWLQNQSHRSVRYLERMVRELEDWGI